jgi:hypothetical protein
MMPRLTLVVALTCTAAIAESQDSGKKKDQPPKAMTAADSAAQLAKKEESRARALAKANTRALFAEEAPIAFTLVANYGALAKDRDTLSTKRFSGTLVVADSAGAERRLPVTLRTRGHFRLMARNCPFVPIRIDFPDSGRKGTPFAGQTGLKLGTHCRNGDRRYDAYTRREYLAYRLFNVVTPMSFRARMATGTYVDSASGKVVATHTAMFIENEDDVATRMGAKIREQMRGALFDDLQQDQLLRVVLFEYLIGNTDFSFAALHNTRVVQSRDGTVYPIAYDFDFSGLVAAHYATPDPRMGIQKVTDRRFRGPCRPLDVYLAAVAPFVEKKAAMLAEVDRVPGITKDDREWALEFLGDFFRRVEKPQDVKRHIVDMCESRPGL